MAQYDKAPAGIALSNATSEEGSEQADVAIEPNGAIVANDTLPRNIDRALAARIQSKTISTCEVLALSEVEAVNGTIAQTAVERQIDSFLQQLSDREKASAQFKAIRADFPGYKQWLDAVRDIRGSKQPELAFSDYIRAEYRQRYYAQLLLEATVYLKDLQLEWSEHQKMLQSALSTGLTAEDVERAYLEVTNGRTFTREAKPASSKTAAPRGLAAAARLVMSDPAFRPSSARVVNAADAASAIALLRNQVDTAAAALEATTIHSEALGEAVIGLVRSSAAEIRGDHERQEARVLLVGDPGAGKRTLLNAILGFEVLNPKNGPRSTRLTSLRRATRASYRGTRSDGRTVLFDDREAARRAKLQHDIQLLDTSLGPTAARTAAELAEPLAAAQSRHATAAAQLANVQSELAASEIELSGAQDLLRDSTESNERMVGECSELRERLQSTKSRLDELEQERAQSSAELLSLAHEAGVELSVPVQALPLAEVERSQTESAQGLNLAHANVPFFLRPAPRWLAWFFIVLRLLLGWRFKQQAEVLSVARANATYVQAHVSYTELIARLTTLAGQAEKVRADLLSSERNLAKTQAQFLAQEQAFNLASEHSRRLSETLAALTEVAETARLALLHSQVRRLDDEACQRCGGEIHALTDPSSEMPQVVELTIDYPVGMLPEGMTLIDAPALSDNDRAARAQTWSRLQRDTLDACVLVSDLAGAPSESLRSSLDELSAQLPDLICVATKMDLVLASIPELEASGAVALSTLRQAARRQVAAQLGTSADDILPIALAAKPEQRGGQADVLARGFPTEAGRLFSVLRSQRAISLARRATKALLNTVQRINEAEHRAGAHYKERIAELERQRLPAPREFRTQTLTTLQAAIAASSAAIIDHARTVMETEIEVLQRRWTAQINECADKEAVKKKIQEVGSAATTAMPGIIQRFQEAASVRSSQELQSLDKLALLAIKRQYRIVEELAGGSPKERQKRLSMGHVLVGADGLDLGASNTYEAFEGTKLALGAGGAIAGAAIGSIVMPGIGTAVGAAIGALATFLKTLDSLKSDCCTQIQAALSSTSQQLRDQLGHAEPDIRLRIRATLELSLNRQLDRHQPWIDELMAYERTRIAQEHQKLVHLAECREKLAKSIATLTEKEREVAALTRTLCA